jgi:hypothetical protein
MSPDRHQGADRDPDGGVSESDSDRYRPDSSAGSDGYQSGGVDRSERADQSDGEFDEGLHRLIAQ